MNDVRLGLDVHTRRSQAIGLGRHVSDIEVEQCRRRARFEQQATSTEIEERESGRVESGNELQADDVTVEGHRPVHVVDVLGDLPESVHRHTRTLGTARQDLFAQDVGVAGVLRELAQDLEVQRPHGPLAPSVDRLVHPPAGEVLS